MAGLSVPCSLICGVDSSCHFDSLRVRMGDEASLKHKEFNMRVIYTKLKHGLPSNV